MDQNLKKNFDLNSATSGVGLAEAIFSCFEASANPTPLAGTLSILIYHYFYFSTFHKIDLSEVRTSHK